MRVKLAKLGAYKHAFIPEGHFMWIGYDTKALVCLDGGFVGHCLYAADVAEIRNRG